MPDQESITILKALRMRLYIRFVYITVLSVVIFIICMKAANKMENKMQFFFIFISWIQVLAIILDAAGNRLLLKNINKEHPSISSTVYKRFFQSEVFRYSITVLGLIWGLLSFAYFMLLCQFSSKSLHYLPFILFEIVVYIILRMGIKRKDEWRDKNKSYRLLEESLFGN